jgi:hypothetical protein
MPKFLKVKVSGSGLEIQKDTVEARFISYNIQLLDMENKKGYSAFEIAADAKLQEEVKEIIAPFNELDKDSQAELVINPEDGPYKPAYAYIKLIYSHEDHHTKESADKAFTDAIGNLTTGNNFLSKSASYAKANDLFWNKNYERNVKLKDEYFAKHPEENKTPTPGK